MMAEPISTTVAATAATTTATSATTAVTTAATTTEAAATTSKQVEIIRRLASAMIYNGESQILNQSEIVDEFATPIYSGLAAATPTPSKTSPHIAAQGTEKAAKIAGAPGGEQVENGTTVSSAADSANANLHPDDSSIAPEPSVSGVNEPSAEKPAFEPVAAERPEIQQLVDKYYKAPTIDSQVKAGNEHIVVERTLIDEKIAINDGKKTAICLIEEKVVDRKYLEYGHLSDVMSEIRHGNIPTIRQIFLAIIDLTDLATLKVFRSALLKYKLEDAKFQIRQLSADLEKKTLKENLPTSSSKQFDLGRSVEKRSWYKTDHVTERIGHKDTSVERHVDLVAVNVRDVCTTEMSRSELDQLIENRNELIQLTGAEDSVVRIENSFSPEQIASINKSAMVWTQENILTSTTEYTTEHHYHRWGTDLKGFLGDRITTSDKETTVSGNKTFSEYLSESDNINLAKIDTYDEALKNFASMKKTATLKADAQVLAKYTAPNAGTRYKDGWITYIPGGSIANLGAKSDLGEKLSGWDYFWAGIDVATIAVAAVTLGTSSSVSAAGKSAIVAGAKTVAKSGAKIASKVVLKNGAKSGVKAIVQSSAKAAVNAGSKATLKQTGKVILTNLGQKAGAKAAVRNATKIVTKTGFRANARYIKNGFTYLTDKQGRVIKASGRLKTVPGVRNPTNQRLAAQLGKLGDEGGHLIPANYGGPGSLINHVPQTRTVNRSVIKRIENEMGQALKAGKKVEYTVMPHYPDPASLRPDKFTIRYVINGIQKKRIIANV